MLRFFEETMTATPSYGNRVLTELSESLSDSGFYCRYALWNEDCPIEEFDAEMAARDFLKADILSSVVRASQRVYVRRVR